MSEHDCTDCGKEHPTVEEALKKLKRQFRLLAVGYFAALLVLAYASYWAFGYGGAGMVVSGWLVHYLHLSVRVTGGNIDYINEAVRQHDMKKIADLRENIGTGNSGQYL